MHFCTAAGIQCAAGGLEMGLRCISVLPPVFSVPPVDSKWVLEAFLDCRRYSVCRRYTENGKKSVPPVALTMVFSLPLLRAGVGVEGGLFSTTVFHQLH